MTDPGGGEGLQPPFSAAPVNGMAAQRPPPVLMPKSLSEKEKNVQLLGALPPDPHRGSAPGPRIKLHQVGLLGYVSTTGLQCGVSFSIMGRRHVEKKA